MRLEDIVADTRVAGLGTGPVTIVAARWHGKDALSVTYRAHAGSLHDQVVFRSDESRLRVVDEASQWSFDADGTHFQLAAEAVRMRMAGQVRTLWGELAWQLGGARHTSGSPAPTRRVCHRARR